jgi:hypothetical protein
MIQLLRIKMRVMNFLGCAMLLVSLASNARASLVLADFESGSMPSGWTTSGPAGTWIVGGATEGNPNVSPAQGSFFARSGEPNARETVVGTLTSPAFTVSFSMLEWLSVGWSGSNPAAGDGSSFFRILDHTFAEVWKTGPAQNDAWETASVDLLGIGLAPGATFYFEARDGRDQSNYAWIGFDNLQLTGAPVAAVPEASTIFIWSLLGLSAFIPGFRRRQGD